MTTKQPKTVTTRVWVSRDCDLGYCNAEPYAIWRRQPRIVDDSFYQSASGNSTTLEDLCVRDFQRLTGLRLKPGECRQFDMTITMTPVETKEAAQ